ncbi:hypothetical protein Pth03_13490 [Planotetraspora thailandica]|uniref:Uncharacterized protein n=1 Tax=Planotetraspora thailandica TaxID=487172 RepID=A0A8J3UYF8_9ACTN|nr:hypothetical protein [Planotetraspora thailandica]GII52960.1 hypothetical protein Pth03_13490 [Planotetraspora thailandica]
MNVTPDYSNIGPGILAFAVVAAIGLALFFLIKSMNRQFAKVRAQDEHGEKQETRESAKNGAEE